MLGLCPKYQSSYIYVFCFDGQSIKALISMFSALMALVMAKASELLYLCLIFDALIQY